MAKRFATDFIVVHCTASRHDELCGAKELDAIHKGFGWDGIGYHYVIRRGGLIELGRELMEEGAHSYGFNRRSVGLVLEGGLDENGEPYEYGEGYDRGQWQSLKILLNVLSRIFTEAQIVGHRDLSPDVDGDGIIERHEWLKSCPCFNVKQFVVTHGIGSHSE